MGAMTDPILYPRFVRSRLEEALEDTPVVLVHGPRQCGKTTLARMVGDAAGYEYITFDDDVQLAAAQADPVGFVADLTDRTVLDEVQRVPALFLSLKTAVDRNRRPGRFILTGSANVLLVPKLADSLAGRMEILRPGTDAEAVVGGVYEPMAADEVLVNNSGGGGGWGLRGRSGHRPRPHGRGDGGAARGPAPGSAWASRKRRLGRRAHRPARARGGARSR